ncbi:hypothetical protein VTI28DRAFT_237 [Corynascus sepedonium]
MPGSLLGPATRPAAARIYLISVYFRWSIPDPGHYHGMRAGRELSQTQPSQARIEGQQPLNDKEGETRKARWRTLKEDGKAIILKV